MTSKSNLIYPNLTSSIPTYSKQSSLVISVDLTDTHNLFDCADKLGPRIAVFKTHINLVSDFGDDTVQGPKRLAEQHNFVIFEDCELIGIRNTVQKQYHGGSLRILEWAHIVNLSVLGGHGIVEAQTQTIKDPDFAYSDKRGFSILAEMTSKGSLAVGSYTEKCATQDKDFGIFTTEINMATKSDRFRQQYQTQAATVRCDPVEAAKAYQKDGWDAYHERTKST
ncbi:Orotidine 5'-phosphate decarboxylase [Xylariaceae sp. FL1019]|nr:Orotidine 5'-phosphate decarboxylase [Xylariaceae sp. FL1019]